MGTIYDGGFFVVLAELPNHVILLRRKLDYLVSLLCIVCDKRFT